MKINSYQRQRYLPKSFIIYITEALVTYIISLVSQSFMLRYVTIFHKVS